MTRNGLRRPEDPNDSLLAIEEGRGKRKKAMAGENREESKGRLACRVCGGALGEASPFCPHCGKSQNKVSLKVPQLLLILLFSCTFAFGLWEWQGALVGDPPKKEFVKSETTSAKHSPHAEAISVLRQQVAENPDDATPKLQLSRMLLQESRSRPEERVVLVREVIALAESILQQDAKNKEALLVLGDAAFEQMAFSQAVDFYQRYLELDPEDLRARTQYASALSFTKDFSGAVEQLQNVLEENPENFHAQAYLAITFAQMGEVEKAAEAGEKALAVSPDEEAGARLRKFLNSLSIETKGSPEGKAGRTGDFGKLQALFRDHAVTGPKYQGYRIEGRTFVALLEDFPVEHMPPFVREKFEERLRAALESEPEVGEIVLFDTQEEKIVLTVPLVRPN